MTKCLQVLSMQYETCIRYFVNKLLKVNFRNLGVVGERILKFMLEEEGGSWGLSSRNNVVP